MEPLIDGATLADPVAGKFSFFPCLTGDRVAQGFAHPAIYIPEAITPKMTQNKRLTQRQTIVEITALWQEVVRRVTEQRIALGIQADLPKAINVPRCTETTAAVLPSPTGRM